MRTRQRERAFSYIIALAMALSLVLYPFVQANAHDPAHANAHDQTKRLQDFHHHGPAPEVTGHGLSHILIHDHGHEDDSPDGGHGGGLHWHFAADHSHEIPANTDLPALTFVGTADCRHADKADALPQGPPFCIERPPRF